MSYDDDELDRALAALPLEEPPPGFRARVLAATVYAPRVPAPHRSLELWLFGTGVAVVAWLAWLVVADGEAARRLGGAITSAFDGLALLPVQTWLWAAIGAGTALWLSLLTIPAPRRIAARR